MASASGYNLAVSASGVQFSLGCTLATAAPGAAGGDTGECVFVQPTVTQTQTGSVSRRVIPVTATLLGGVGANPTAGATNLSGAAPGASSTAGADAGAATPTVNPADNGAVSFRREQLWFMVAMVLPLFITLS